MAGSLVAFAPEQSQALGRARGEPDENRRRLASKWHLVRNVNDFKYESQAMSGPLAPFDYKCNFFYS